jgi:hypothetical protein
LLLAANERLTERDPSKPRGERRTAFELPEVRVRVEEALLGDVLRLAVAAQHGAGDAEHPLIVTTHEKLEQLGTAP